MNVRKTDDADYAKTVFFPERNFVLILYISNFLYRLTLEMLSMINPFNLLSGSYPIRVHEYMKRRYQLLEQNT